MKSVELKVALIGNSRGVRLLAVLAGVPDAQLVAEETLARFDLGAKSTVQTALESLVGEETLQREQRGKYLFDDPYYRRWVQLNIVADLGLSVPEVGSAW